MNHIEVQIKSINLHLTEIFYYLTGINDTKVILTILKTEDEVIETIYVQREDELMAKWIGLAISK